MAKSKPTPKPKNGSRRIAVEPTPAEALAKTEAREPAKIQEASRILRLAGCDTRLRILFFLQRANSAAAEIRSEIEARTDQAISHQCSQLVNGRLVFREARGKTIVYSLTPDGAKLVRLLEGIITRPTKDLSNA